jgi:hypothetical protein
MVKPEETVEGAVEVPVVMRAYSKEAVLLLISGWRRWADETRIVLGAALASLFPELEPSSQIFASEQGARMQRYDDSVRHQDEHIQKFRESSPAHVHDAILQGKLTTYRICLELLADEISIFSPEITDSLHYLLRSFPSLTDKPTSSDIPRSRQEVAKRPGLHGHESLASVPSMRFIERTASHHTAAGDIIMPQRPFALPITRQDSRISLLVRFPWNPFRFDAGAIESASPVSGIQTPANDRLNLALEYPYNTALRQNGQEYTEEKVEEEGLGRHPVQTSPRSLDSIISFASESPRTKKKWKSGFLSRARHLFYYPRGKQVIRDTNPQSLDALDLAMSTGAQKGGNGGHHTNLTSNLGLMETTSGSDARRFYERYRVLCRCKPFCALLRVEERNLPSINPAGHGSAFTHSRGKETVANQQHRKAFSSPATGKMHLKLISDRRASQEQYLLQPESSTHGLQAYDSSSLNGTKS